MQKLVINGGKPLKGEVIISGSKNASLPALAATLLTDEPCVLKNVPRVSDIDTMSNLLMTLGKDVRREKDALIIRSKGRLKSIADYRLVSTMRGSVCVLGPLLARLGEARVALPGGCVIGVRPVDLHLKGFECLGAKIDIEGGYIIAKVSRLKGARMYLAGAMGPSVLGTANIMMAATLAKGDTVIEGAACEPEIKDLADLLNLMGARIQGQGSPTIVINGVRRLHGVEHKVSSDRIEAGTFILLSAMTRGNVIVRGVEHHRLISVIDTLRSVGVSCECQRSSVRVKVPVRLKAINVTTHPYPGFPTDLQAQYMALMTLADGVTSVRDTVFPDRFMHLSELARMGAKVRREGGVAVIEGVKELKGAPVMASDLRASVALVMAGLVASGQTEVRRIYHLDRGYQGIDQKLIALGAHVRREQDKVTPSSIFLE